MITGFEVKEGTKEEQVLFFKKVILTDNTKRVCLLLGANGSGKTTLIDGLYPNQFSGKSGIVVAVDKATKTIIYRNHEDNLRHMADNRYNPDCKLIVEKMRANYLSEGQSIIYSVKNIFDIADDATKEFPEEDLVFLLDEVDSGLSVDNVQYVCTRIKKALKKNPNLQFVIAFNNYHFVQEFKYCVSMYSGEEVKIDSYEEYVKFINDNKADLKKKRKNNMMTGNFLDGGGKKKKQYTRGKSVKSNSGNLFEF